VDTARFSRGYSRSRPDTVRCTRAGCSSEVGAPAGFFGALAGMVVCYLVLIEIGKRIFYVSLPTALPTRRNYRPHHHLRRRTAYFRTATRHPGLTSTSEPPSGRYRHSQVSE
jgi:hypothetical protein